MTLDQIISMTDRLATIEALEACRSHADDKWVKAWIEACKDTKVSIQAIFWLNEKARKEIGWKDRV